MNRAESFQHMSARVQGGGPEKVWLVTKQIVGADPSRGVQGTITITVRELVPTPTFEPITGELLTTKGAVLKSGDLLVDLRGNQIAEPELQDINTVIRRGDSQTGPAFQIVLFEREDFGKGILLYRVFCRGISVT